MPMTFWDMARRDSADSWRRIRTLRSAPPARVTPDRRLLFSSALEQAEQQFEAATRVPSQSRAINLFYGLSQAGRAIACAYAGLAEDFELNGHGITNRGLDQISADDLPTLTVLAQGRPNASFRRLSALLGSSPLDAPVELGAVWATLVEPNLRGERLTADHWPTLLVTASPDQPGQPCIVTLPREIVPPDQGLGELATVYPALGIATVTREAGTSRNAAGTEMVSYELMFPNGLRDIGSYRGDPAVFPAVPTGARELHPLMAWWATLFSLSMLTRYRPQTWSALVSVDTSRYAVPIEFLLQAALEAIPDLVGIALDGAPSTSELKDVQEEPPTR